MTSYRKNSPAIRFKHLEYFLALAEHGSISSAAQALEMAQPSLSNHISNLEKRLGMTLVLRAARGVSLTPAGALLAARGAKIITEIEALTTDLQALTAPAQTRISIGLPPGISGLISVPLMETLQSEFPDLKVHIAEAMSGDIMDWLTKDRVDVGLIYTQPDPQLYDAIALMDEELFLVTAPDNWDGEIGPESIARAPIHATDLAGLPLILTSSSHGARRLNESFARSIGIALNVVSDLDSLPQILEMVGRASAYTILSHGSTHVHMARGSLALVPIRNPKISRMAYVVTKRSQRGNQALATIRKQIFIILNEVIARHGLHATWAPLPD